MICELRSKWTLRLLRIVLCISLVFCLRSSAQTNDGPADWQVQLNDGEYQMIGIKPAGFEDFDSMWVSKFEINAQGKVVAKPPKGGVSIAVGKIVTELPMKQILFSGKHLLFRTTSLSGIAYRFDGRYPGRFTTDERGAITGEVLRGTLIKNKSGVRIASAIIAFKFQVQGE